VLLKTPEEVPERPKEDTDCHKLSPRFLFPLKKMKQLLSPTSTIRTTKIIHTFGPGPACQLHETPTKPKPSPPRPQFPPPALPAASIARPQVPSPAPCPAPSPRVRARFTASTSPHRHPHAWTRTSRQRPRSSSSSLPEGRPGAQGEARDHLQPLASAPQHQELQSAVRGGCQSQTSMSCTLTPGGACCGKFGENLTTRIKIGHAPKLRIL
jgi:hypothetical protein